LQSALEPTAPAMGKVLSFQLDGERYSIDILKIREIVGLMPITPLPQASPFVRGVMNLRGKIIPVLDLRRRFGLSEASLGREACIITCDVPSGTGLVLAGLLVDSVEEVAPLGANQLEPLPDLGGPRSGWVRGLIKSKDKVAILLDVDKVIKDSGLDALEIPSGPLTAE